MNVAIQIEFKADRKEPLGELVRSYPTTSTDNCRRFATAPGADTNDHEEDDNRQPSTAHIVIFRFTQ